MKLVGDIGGFGGTPGGQGITVQDLIRAGLIAQDQVGPGGTLLGTEAVRLGGFHMGADYIRDVANSFGLASTVTAGDDVRFWAGATFANRATAPLRLTEAGALTATSATISGTVTATAGTIGGFTLGATTLTAASGGNTTIVSSGATAFSAGPTGSPTVTITQAGVLTASGGTFTGTITATDGAIGGFVIASDHIRNSGNAFGLSSANENGSLSIRIWAGTTFASRTTASYRVDEQGSVWCGNIVAANITATGLKPDTNGTRDIGDGTHYIGVVYTVYTQCGGTIFASGAYNQTTASQGMISQHGSHDLAAAAYKLGLVPSTGTAPYMYFNVGGKVCLFLDATGASTAS